MICSIRVGTKDLGTAPSGLGQRIYDQLRQGWDRGSMICSVRVGTEYPCSAPVVPRSGRRECREQVVGQQVQVLLSLPDPPASLSPLRPARTLSNCSQVIWNRTLTTQFHLGRRTVKTSREKCCRIQDYILG